MEVNSGRGKGKRGKGEGGGERGRRKAMRMGSNVSVVGSNVHDLAF